jgi:hypothetical protein
MEYFVSGTAMPYVLTVSLLNEEGVPFVSVRYLLLVLGIVIAFVQ